MKSTYNTYERFSTSASPNALRQAKQVWIPTYRRVYFIRGVCPRRVHKTGNKTGYNPSEQSPLMLKKCSTSMVLANVFQKDRICYAQNDSTLFMSTNQNNWDWWRFTRNCLPNKSSTHFQIGYNILRRQKPTLSSRRRSASAQIRLRLVAVRILQSGSTALTKRRHCC